MPKKEPNWWPGIQKQAPFQRGMEPDNPRHFQPTKRKVSDDVDYDQTDQLSLPMDTDYLKPVLCPECSGLGRERKGRLCRACKGCGVIPANPTRAADVGADDLQGEV